MKTLYLTLFVALLSTNVYAKTEPVKCYEIAWDSRDNGGFGLNLGSAIELCGGTKNANETLDCFVEAFNHPDHGGLGLNLGSAVALCKDR